MDKKQEIEQSPKITLRSFLFGISLAIIVYLAIIIISGWEDLLKNLLQIHPFIVILAMLLSLANYFFRFLKWHLFTRSLMIDITPQENFIVFIAGLSLAITPAKVGETIRAFLLRKFASTDLSKGLASTFSERLVDLLAVTILALIGILFFGLRESAEYTPLLMLILSIIIVAVIGFLFDPLYNLFRWFFYLRFWRRLGPKVDKFRSDVIITFRYDVFLGALIFGMIGWACEGIGFFLLAQNLNIDLDLDIAIFIYTTSSLLGAISFLPGGLGVMEGSMEIFFANFLEIPPSLAGALIILIRMATLWFGVTLGLIFLLYAIKRLENKIGNQSNNF